MGCIFYNVLKMAKRDKIKFVLSGLGSDEIFAGYQRHEKDINECWKDLKKVLDNDIKRDKDPFLDGSADRFDRLQFRTHTTSKGVFLVDNISYDWYN